MFIAASKNWYCKWSEPLTPQFRVNGTFFGFPKLSFGKCRHLEETYVEWWWNYAVMKGLKIILWQTRWHCRMCACEAHWSQRSEGSTKQTLRHDVGHYNYYHLRIRPTLVMINLHYQEEHLHNAMFKTKKIGHKSQRIPLLRNPQSWLKLNLMYITNISFLNTKNQANNTTKTDTET